MRRVLFLLHLWVGLTTGVYIFIVSLSGSLIVYRRELDRVLCPARCEPAWVSWLAEFHDHLGLGRTGLLFNGLGAAAATLMCLTGAVLWWPGRTRWRRSLTLHRGLSPRRMLWELHNVLGFWLLLLILLWSVTGLYFAFPAALNALDDDTIAAVVRLHFGRAFGPGVEALWVILGLVPCALVLTGVLMWGIRKLPATVRTRRDPSARQTPDQ